MGVIVVGVDSSEGAKAALRFALEEARLRQATLRAVHAWQFEYIGAGMEGAYPALVSTSAACTTPPRRRSKQQSWKLSRTRARSRSSAA